MDPLPPPQESEMSVLQRVLATPEKIEPALNTCQVCRVSWRHALGQRLFPSTPLKWPEFEGAKDGLHHRVVVELSFLDRLRVLFTGRCSTLSLIRTEGFIGAYQVESQFTVEPPSFLTQPR